MDSGENCTDSDAMRILFAFVSLKMIPNIFTFSVLREKAYFLLCYTEKGRRLLIVDVGPWSVKPVPPIISIVRREGIILGNEDARICWPFDLTEKLYSESDGQSLCSPTPFDVAQGRLSPESAAAERRWGTHVGGNVSNPKNLGCATRA